MSRKPASSSIELSDTTNSLKSSGRQRREASQQDSAQMFGPDSCFGCLDIHETVETEWRTVNIRTDESNDATLDQVGSRNNGITTSKYTIYTWIPKGTFEQFRRLANIYFLIISVMMLIGTYTTLYENSIQYYTTLGPLLIIIGCTLIKEGLEDKKRHESDHEVNSRKALVLCQRAKGGFGGDNEYFREVAWHDLQPGMVVKVGDREEIPADMVCLSSSDPEGKCYIETANIDGETNLKLRKCAACNANNSNMGWTSPGELVGDASVSVKFEPPNLSIHTFSGTVTAASPRSQAPCGATELCLRGAVVRNTKWVLGVVMYTGKDTKLVMNSRDVPSKMSTIENTVNRMIYFILFADILLTTAVTIARAVWNMKYAKYTWYLCGGGVKKYYKDCGVELFEKFCFAGLEENTKYDDASYWATFFILFNNFLPLSLYVTLEIVNFVQAYYVDQDLEMYDAEQDTPALARTSNQNGDLGQIEYVFSDKTGTLTCNEMKFRRCSVSGVIYGNVNPGGETTTADEAGVDGQGPPTRTPTGSGSDQMELTRGSKSGPLPPAISPPSGAAVRVAGEGAVLHGVPPPGMVSNGVPVGKPLASLRAAAVRHGRDTAAMHFAMLLASCHTVVVEKDEEGHESYQAESPDEEALVDGGEKLGYRYVGSTSESIKLRQTESGEELVLEKLALIPFNSTRKRMSIVAKVDGEYRLYIKGADNVMFDRAGAGAATNFQKDLPDGSKVRDNDGFKLVGGRRELEQHLEMFAEEGLRTLVLAVKVLDEAWAKEWVAKWNHAQTLVDRDTACVEVAKEIEDSGLTVVGATAIEDRLQDGVPSTIADLKGAGIKVWVLTGDKMTTAINIGFSCRLLTPDMTLIMLDKEDPNQKDEDGKPVEVRTPAEKLNWNYDKYSALTRSDSVRLGFQRSMCLDWLGNCMGFSADAPAANASGVAPGGRPTLRSSLSGVPPAPELHELDTDHLALIVDGPSLDEILQSPDLTRKLLHLGCFCKAVVACRVSPAQKQLVVKMVKDGLPNHPITLSIGDGANDVPMIQEAQIGVGISGKEGRQAVNSSDFAIAQFRFLKRLLLVHGRFNYRRTSKVIIYSFYKNIVLVIVLFLYSCYSSFSGQSLYGADSWCYSGYNFFLGLPPFFLGFFDMDVSPKMAMTFHKLYYVGLKNQDLNLTKMIESFGFAIWDAFLIYYLTHLSYNDSTWQERGKTSGLNVFGNSVFAVMVWAMMYRMCLTFSSWNALSVFSIFFSFAFYLVFIFSYSAIGPYNETLGDVGEYAFYMIPYHMFAIAGFWMTLLLVPITSFACMFLVKAIRTEFFTTRDVVAAEYEQLVLKQNRVRNSRTDLLTSMDARHEGTSVTSWSSPASESDGPITPPKGSRGTSTDSMGSSRFGGSVTSQSFAGTGADMSDPKFKVDISALEEVHADMERAGGRESHGHRYALKKKRSSSVMDHVEAHSYFHSPSAGSVSISAKSSSFGPWSSPATIVEEEPPSNHESHNPLASAASSRK